MLLNVIASLKDNVDRYVNLIVGFRKGKQVYFPLWGVSYLTPPMQEAMELIEDDELRGFDLSTGE